MENVRNKVKFLFFSEQQEKYAKHPGIAKQPPKNLTNQMA